MEDEIELSGRLHQNNLKVQDHEHTKPPDEMIAAAGYPAETHSVVTKDGYILKVHRIPHGKDKRGRNNSRPTVFLMHGLLSSSADWVVTGPEQALAYLLADEGYDVWMGNFRGNTYSNRHANSTLDKLAYWSFSWDEMAEHDLPTMLAHMQEVSGQQKFFYIGHSMGTLTYYTACNYAPWIANSTRLMVGYGPHTRVPHMTSPLFKVMAYFVKEGKWILEHLGIYNFLPSNWLTEFVASEVCDVEMATQSLCRNMMYLMAGYNNNEMNETALPYIVGHAPAGTSTLNMLHYAQSVNTGAWSGYDLGNEAANMQRWNSSTPPNYRYDVVTAPVALHWSLNDWLVVPQDAADLASKLPNVVLNHEVAEAAYTHLDFLWGIHNRKLLYGPTLEFMKKY